MYLKLFISLTLVIIALSVPTFAPVVSFCIAAIGGFIFASAIYPYLRNRRQ